MTQECRKLPQRATVAFSRIDGGIQMLIDAPCDAAKNTMTPKRYITQASNHQSAINQM